MKLCKKPIFILGAPRSGTTVAAWALAEHSQLWTSGESYVLAEIFGGARGDKNFNALFQTAEVLGDGSLIQQEMMSRTELLAALGLGVNALFTSRSGDRRWIDHTPVQSLMVDRLGEMFPDAQFLHLLRDGRRAVHSMIHFQDALQPAVREKFKKAGWDIPWLDFTEACRTWREYAGKVLDFSVANPGRCLTVRQEHLVSRPEETFASIYQFLGLSPEAGPIQLLKTQRLHSSFSKKLYYNRSPWNSWTPSQKEIFIREAGPVYYRHGLATQSQLRAGLAMPSASVRRLKSPRARLIAFHLPHFHPTPEGEASGVRGATEWTAVAKSQPLFAGHDQPRLPADLGYYDLRLPETRAQQAALAREHGIEAFCYWHYWSGGRRRFERPVNEILATGHPDFPFCLAWSNQTRSDLPAGRRKGIPVKQIYSAADDRAHAAWLASAFQDPRYLRVDGHPVFAINRPDDLPDLERFAAAVRAACKKKKLPAPHLIGINSGKHTDWRRHGLDASLNFEPQLGGLPKVRGGGVNVFDYATVRKHMRRRKPGHTIHPCIFTGMDTTPHLGKKGVVVRNATPERFAKGLEEMIRSVESKPFEQRLVFVNAWNDWAQGTYLEPDQKHGRKYLEAVLRVNRSGK